MRAPASATAVTASPSRARRVHPCTTWSLSSQPSSDRVAGCIHALARPNDHRETADGRQRFSLPEACASADDVDTDRDNTK